jgi:putative transposase
VEVAHLARVSDPVCVVLHPPGEPARLLSGEHPDESWMEQMARNATGESRGNLERRRYALHDRDTKFCDSFRATLTSGGIRPIQLPKRSPNLNAFAKRWVRSVKQECLSKLILFGEASCDVR